MIRCAECNGINIETKAWIDPNDDTVFDLASDGDTDDNWCRDCNKHVNFIYND